MTAPTTETSYPTATREADAPGGAARRATPVLDVPRALSTLAGVAGVLIGLISVGVGGATVLGFRNPGYLTLDWLLSYNIALGVMSLAVGAAILARRLWSPAVALSIAASRAVVLVWVTVLWASSSAASHSVGAMVFRTLVWLGVGATAWAALRSKPRPSRERPF